MLAYGCRLSPGNGFWGGGGLQAVPYISFSAPHPLQTESVPSLCQHCLFLAFPDGFFFPFPWAGAPHCIPLPTPGWMENRIDGLLGQLEYCSVTFLKHSRKISSFSPGRLTHQVPKC